MSDITLCSTKLCPMEPWCRRKTTQPTEHQSYVEYTVTGDHCTDFWPISPDIDPAAHE